MIKTKSDFTIFYFEGSKFAFWFTYRNPFAWKAYCIPSGFL